ncbi:hypothetical protein [Aliiruegeria sabulilitoris]|uniref:hypothetical protein n=1 Tax=Aliiruegeria sabulilitoris TaxID=1510458 RepID=UPI000836CF1A|nr:hypothetical protein [Aliiruegeria sabulilitoris]NDR59555.1 hypothetical protein [Pseudoruegeria sp. M32A2M]
MVDDPTIVQDARLAILYLEQVANSLQAERDLLPSQLQYSFDRFLAETRECQEFNPSNIFHARDLCERLGHHVEAKGGAPHLEHSDEGDPFWVGGTEESRRLATIARPLEAYIARSGTVYRAFEADAAMERLRLNLAKV